MVSKLGIWKDNYDKPNSVHINFDGAWAMKDIIKKNMPPKSGRPSSNR